MAYGFPEAWAATSSRLHVDQDERHMGMLFAAAAREVPTSPSGWANMCAAAGENPNGAATLLVGSALVGCSLSMGEGDLLVRRTGR